MATPIHFSVISTEDGARMGKLRVPYRKSADWINFLVSPRQQVQIVLAENHRSGLILYFQADDRLYGYLNEQLQRINQAEDSVAAAIAT